MCGLLAISLGGLTEVRAQQLGIEGTAEGACPAGYEQYEVFSPLEVDASSDFVDSAATTSFGEGPSADDGSAIRNAAPAPTPTPDPVLHPPNIHADELKREYACRPNPIAPWISWWNTPVEQDDVTNVCNHCIIDANKGDLNKLFRCITVEVGQIAIAPGHAGQCARGAELVCAVFKKCVPTFECFTQGTVGVPLISEGHMWNLVRLPGHEEGWLIDAGNNVCTLTD